MRYGGSWSIYFLVEIVTPYCLMRESNRQGTNERKVISEVTHFLYGSLLSLGGNVNTRRMVQPDMGSIFHKKIDEIFWSLETIM